ncbi:hypothetical protein PFLUV_G00081960 [Scomber scombrus]|uniref:Uncharacterized protein n=1 Tax=Scomber scombrus TaxID=13677 RepID=A0AAV1N5F5_SCOSC
MEEAAKISDMTIQEDPEIYCLKTVLSEAQLLMREIEELLDWCSSAGPSNQRRCRMIQQKCQASIEEDGETLVIDSFRFESATSREGLRRLSSQAVAGGLQGDT